MTFIVAFPCQDGLVLASDSLAVTPVGGQPTKSTVQKIFLLGKHFLWGCAGDANDIQRFRDTIGKIQDEIKKSPLDEPRLKECLRIFAHIVQVETMGTRCPQYLVVGHQEHPLIWSMVNNCDNAFFGIDHPEIIKSNLFAIGTPVGQWAARALFNRLKFVSRDYNLAQGTLVAYRLVKEAISVDTYVGEPIDVWTVANNEPKRKLPEELKELESLYNIWTNAERHKADAIMSLLD
jgi:20S proteasome alpha/beta subunit